jgi:hypothetical protein
MGANAFSMTGPSGSEEQRATVARRELPQNLCTAHIWTMAAMARTTHKGACRRRHALKIRSNPVTSERYAKR